MADIREMIAADGNQSLFFGLGPLHEVLLSIQGAQAEGLSSGLAIQLAANRIVRATFSADEFPYEAPTTKRVPGLADA